MWYLVVNFIPIVQTPQLVTLLLIYCRPSHKSRFVPDRRNRPRYPCCQRTPSVRLASRVRGPLRYHRSTALKVPHERREMRLKRSPNQMPLPEAVEEQVLLLFPQPAMTPLLRRLHRKSSQLLPHSRVSLRTVTVSRSRRRRRWSRWTFGGRAVRAAAVIGHAGSAPGSRQIRFRTRSHCVHACGCRCGVGG